MITVIGFFLLVLILFVIYAPFNEKFFNIYKFGKYKSFVNLNDNSDLYSLINDFNSGLMSFNEFKNEIVDTLTLARDKFPGSQVSLDALCKRFRIDNSRRAKHTALIDCDLLAKVYINLIDQKEPTLNFENNNSDLENSNNTKVSYYKKIVKPNYEEIKNHQNYLKQNLKKKMFFFSQDMEEDI